MVQAQVHDCSCIWINLGPSSSLACSFLSDHDSFASRLADDFTTTVILATDRISSGPIEFSLSVKTLL